MPRYDIASRGEANILVRMTARIAVARSRVAAGAQPLWLEIVVLAILAAPSVWLLTTLPPLWRDSDAYNQLMQRPGSMTIVHFPPLYCFVARVPLYLGAIWESWRAGGTLPGASFFRTPLLTDSGIFLLVIIQHALLLLGQSFLLRGLRAAPAIAILLALLMAANASFYSFAHCVGSEAFSVAATLCLLAICLRIVQRGGATLRDWCCLGVSLVACILSRHINAVLVMLLPCVYVFIAALRVLRSRASSRRAVLHWLRAASVAVAVGAASLLVAKGSVRLLRREFHVKTSSTLGFTFLWRLNFLAQMNAADRAAFLVRLSNADDPFRQLLLNTIATAAAQDGRWDPVRVHGEFHQAIVAAEPRHASVRLYASENDLARRVVLSAPAAYRHAVQNDFVTSVRETPPSLARAPFETTRYADERLPELPGLAALRTFQPTAMVRLTAGRENAYFSFLRFPYWSAIAASAVLAAASLAIGGRAADRIVSFSAALVCVALTMMFLNCALTEFLARYTLPLWNLLFVAVLLQVAMLGDAAAPRPAGITA